MCTLLFAFDAHPEYRLVVAANRDEFYARPTAAAGPWDDAPHVIAGRDLRAGGTWLGMTTSGRWAALTNVRDPRAPRDGQRSRGWLVRDYLVGELPPDEYLRAVAAEIQLYSGFNLVVGDRHGVWFLSSRQMTALAIEPGVHGVSNGSFNSPWPKVEHGRNMLELAVSSLDDDEPIEPGVLLDALADDQRFPDETLPDTGVGLETERMLSPLFIAAERYGTCSSTVITVKTSGDVEFVERTTNPTAADRSDVSHRIRLD